ncbi:helix-turn-helix domain-containing protein [Polynucleobacter paneuropaeus]|jgi:predicted DNA-binding transcriptional regulator AlpA|nr:helix-turn-helix domain-containing protein [Polynucleobacter paneuropaeus]
MKANKEFDNLLSVEKVCEMLAVSRAWLGNDRKKNREIPFIRLGGCIRYRLLDIETHIAKNIIGEKK